MSNGPVIDVFTWQQEVARRVAAIGARAVSLQFDDKAPTARTDGKSIICPLPPMNATYEDYQILRGHIIHEVGHLVRPEVFTLVKDHEIDMRSKLGTLLNQIEDRVQEACVAKAYRGDALSLDRMHSITTRRQMAKLTKEGLPDGCDLDTVGKLWASMLVGIRGAKWMHETARVTDIAEGVMRRTVLPTGEWIDTLTKEGWGERINKEATPREVLDLAIELFKRLFPEDPLEEQYKENPAKSGKGAGVTKGDETGKAEDGRIPWWLVKLTDHDEHSDEPHPGSIDWTGKEYTDRVPDLITDVSVVDKFSDSSNSYKSSIATHSGEGKFPASVVGEVRRRLQAKTRCRWQNEKLDGKLDVRNTGRLILPQVGDGTYNRSVFKRRVPGLKLDVSVTILVDTSGSMSGDKYVNACVAAMALNELCQRALRVPSEILGFTHTMDSAVPRIYVHKAFHERAMPRDTLVQRMGSSVVQLVGNSDAEAVMYAVGRLRKTTTARKVLIVLSDGAPADAKVGGCPEAYNNLKKVISLVRSAKDVELYGIGIQDHNVRKFYSAKAPVVNDSEDVAPALLAVLSDVLQKIPDGGA